MFDKAHPKCYICGNRFLFESVKAVRAMSKRRREVHIYLDNSAWGHLHDKAKFSIKVCGKTESYKVKDKDVRVFEKSEKFKPVLSEENYREFCKSLVGKNRDSRERSRRILRFVISRAWPRVFSEKDILTEDIKRVVSGRKGNYFMEIEQAKSLRNAFLKPHKYLPKIKEIVDNSDQQKQAFVESTQRFFGHVDMIRQRHNPEGTLGDLSEDDFRALYLKFQKPQVAMSFVKKTLRGIGIQRISRDLAYFIACIDKSRVFSGRLKHICAGIIHQLKRGRSRVDPNDLLDRRHYMMSGFCEYFVTDDNDLLSVLSIIPEEYRHVKVMSLPEFIKGPLAGDG